MILKALKILPYTIAPLSGATLINDHPQKNADTPQTESWSAYPNEVQWIDQELDLGVYYNHRYATKKSALYETDLGDFEIKTYSETTYRKSAQSNQIVINKDNWNKYIPVQLYALKISNLQGINVITNDFFWATILNNLVPTEKYLYNETKIYVGDSRISAYFDFSLYDYRVNEIVYQLENNYATTLLREVNNTISTNNQTDIELNDGTSITNYNLYASNGNYYFYLVNKLYSDSNTLQISTEYNQVDQVVFVNNDDGIPLELSLVQTTIYNTQEIVNVPGIMFDVLTMPFSFISQAFNLTLFPNTAYSVNVSNLFLSILAVIIFVFIIKLIIGMRQ